MSAISAPALSDKGNGTEMNRLSAYRLRLVCLYPFALLLLAAPLLAQDAPTPDGTATAAAGTVEAGTLVAADATGTFAAVTSTAAAAAGTGTAAVVNATSTAIAITSTAAANATGTVTAATSTALAAPPLLQPTATPQPSATLQPTPTPISAIGGLGDRLVPLLIGGLFLLAGLAIIGLLLTRRRRVPRPATRGVPAVARPVIAPPPAVGAETVTGVLMPVYLQLEGDAPQSFAINETPFAIGRDPANNLIIDETFPAWQTVSREHALISRHERGYVVEDLGSQNGVRVNGRLTPKNLLRSGWQVTIGGVAFRFVDETQTNGWVAP